MKASGGASAILWAARLGELCGRAGTGAEPERSFLQDWVELAGAQAGLLSLKSSRGESTCVSVGFDGVRLDELWSNPFPRAAYGQLARGESVALLEQGADDDWWPRPGFGEAALERLLSVVVGDDAGLRAVLVAGWVEAAGEALVEPTALLFSSLERALLRLSEPRPRARPAWERSRVPLIFIRGDGSVAEVNPAARRKLGLNTGDAALPMWLRDTVLARIRQVRETGTELGEKTGEQTFFGATDGRADYRVGLAPIQAETGEERWLLTVEKGGPSLWERVEQAEDALGLTPRESLVLELLARGMSNRQIAEVATVKEATVKYHLFSVMRKSGTANRTELLAAFYAGDLSGQVAEDEDVTEEWTDQVDLGFVTITTGSGGLVSVVFGDGVELDLPRTRLLLNEIESRFDSPAKLYADIAGLTAISRDATGLFASRSGLRVRAAAVRATTQLGRAAAGAYKPPYPMRLFRSREEAMAWLASLD